MGFPPKQKFLNPVNIVFDLFGGMGEKKFGKTSDWFTDRKLFRENDAVVAATPRSQSRMQPVEIAAVEREDRPSLGEGEIQLFVIGQALFLDLVGADNIVAFQPQSRGHLFVDILVELQFDHLGEFPVDFVLIVKIVALGVEQLGGSQRRVPLENFFDAHPGAIVVHDRRDGNSGPFNDGFALVFGGVFFNMEVSCLSGRHDRSPEVIIANHSVRFNVFLTGSVEER